MLGSVAPRRIEISGVELIFRGETPYVLEVNAADAMVEYAVAKAKAGDPKPL